MGCGLNPKAVNFRPGNIFLTLSQCLLPKGRKKKGFINEKRIECSFHKDETVWILEHCPGITNNYCELMMRNLRDQNKMLSHHSREKEITEYFKKQIASMNFSLLLKEAV